MTIITYWHENPFGITKISYNPQIPIDIIQKARKTCEQNQAQICKLYFILLFYFTCQWHLMHQRYFFYTNYIFVWFFSCMKQLMLTLLKKWWWHFEERYKSHSAIVLNAQTLAPPSSCNNTSHCKNTSTLSYSWQCTHVRYWFNKVNPLPKPYVEIYLKS